MSNEPCNQRFAEQGIVAVWGLRASSLNISMSGKCNKLLTGFCGFAALHRLALASRRPLSMCLWTHEKKTFFSCQRLTRSGGVSQGRAPLRAA